MPAKKPKALGSVGYILGGDGTAPQQIAQEVYPQPLSSQSMTATLATGAKASSSSVEPRGKYLVGVQVTTNGTPNGAGIYARVLEITGAASSIVRVLWSGYVRPNQSPPSIPNTQTKIGHQYLLEAWCISDYDAKTVTATLFFADEPGGGTDIHSEAPGSGVGEIVVKTLAAPAAGSSYTALAPAQLERWKIRSFNGTLTTSAAAANRYVGVTYAGGGGVVVSTGGAVSTDAVTASQVVIFSWGTGATSGRITNAAGGGIDTRPLPDVWTYVGYGPAFTTQNIQAGDQWSAGYVVVEMWVVPT